MQVLKKGNNYIFTFLITVVCLMGMLVCSAMIPRKMLKDNIEESAIYLCEGELFAYMVDGVNGSKVDRYADSILLAIAYQYDSEKPLTSVMWSSYYFSKYQNENENLLDAVTKELEPNQQYLRYWHGSNSIVRPLLVVFNIKQIYMLNGILLTGLAIALLTVLIRRKAYAPAIGMLAGLIGVGCWFVTFSLEYSWTFFVMLIISLVGVIQTYKCNAKKLGVLFLICGMLTNYLDFLTTETITLTVPLLLVLWIEQSKAGYEGIQCLIKTAGKLTVCWSCGYIGMWVMKWGIASIVLGENIMPYVSQHIGERIGGNLGLGPLQFIWGAIWNNIRCIFPLEYGIIGLMIGFCLILLIIYTGYVYHASSIDSKMILLYVLVGMIPYIRYIVLHNHSYVHYFFTYRAQVATILAICLIWEKITDRRWPVNANKRKRRA